jgi:DNA polymerase III delta subunit
MKEKELTAVEKLFNIWLNREYITADEWLEAIEMEQEQRIDALKEAYSMGRVNKSIKEFNKNFKL